MFVRNQGNLEQSQPSYASSTRRKAQQSFAEIQDNDIVVSRFGTAIMREGRDIGVTNSNGTSTAFFSDNNVRDIENFIDLIEAPEKKKVRGPFENLIREMNRIGVVGVYDSNSLIYTTRMGMRIFAQTRFREREGVWARIEYPNGKVRHCSLSVRDQNREYSKASDQLYTLQHAGRVKYHERDERILKGMDKIVPFYSKRGQVIICADYRDILPLLANRSIGIVISDIPYGINHRTSEKIPRRIMGDDGSFSLTDAVAPLLRVLRHQALAYIFSDAMKMSEDRKALLKLPIAYLHSNIWNKKTLGRGRGPHRWGWEHFFSFTNAKKAFQTYNPDHDVMDYDRIRGKKLHPMQKPLEFLQYLIRTKSRDYDTVLDICAGSGSTAVAAFREGRRSISIDIDPKWCKIAAERLDREKR